ncbi:MAG: response regulator [Pseudomonadota bacterium]
MRIDPYRLICVDDDPLALDQLRAVLSKIDIPIACEFFGSPSRALEAHRREPADLVLSDLRLGATTGLKLIVKMQNVAPECVYMLISGEADLESALIAMNEARVFRFFTKPAVADEIRLGLYEGIRELNLRKMRKISSTTLEAIERMKMAVATVRVDGEIIYANKPAQDIFSESGFFDTARKDYLRSIDAEQTKKFFALLKDVAQRDSEDSGRSVFRFAHPDKPNPIVVSLVFCQADNDQDPHFNMVILDPARTDITTPKVLAAALRLTPSEARIVHGLVEGDSVEDAARRAGVSLSTARTYLKTVFSKTGVSRQAELVRLALLTAA